MSVPTSRISSLASCNPRGLVSLCRLEMVDRARKGCLMGLLDLLGLNQGSCCDI